MFYNYYSVLVKFYYAIKTLAITNTNMFVCFQLEHFNNHCSLVYQQFTYNYKHFI